MAFAWNQPIGDRDTRSPAVLATAASGHATAAPPSSVMNSRRLNWSNCIQFATAGLDCRISNGQGSVSGSRRVRRLYVAAHPRQISFIDRRIHFADSKARPAAYLSRHVASCVSLEKAYPAHPYERWRTLRTILQACEYMVAIGKERELRPHWQQVRELMLQEAEVAAVSWRVRLAVLKDAKLDVSALSEPFT